MIGKLIWKKSGDEIDFSPTFPDLLIYYVDALNASGANSFRLQSTEFKSDQCTALEKSIQAIAKVSHKIPFVIDNWDGDIHDQDYLNLLHKQWVLTGLKYPTMPLLLRKMGQLDEDFRDINNLLHKVEESFVYDFVNYDCDQYQIDNVFGEKVLGFDQANLSIGFDNLGRSSWSKFCNFDENITDVDTNNFEKLAGLVHFNLKKPISGNPPPEYVTWCHTHGVPVVGKSLSLGNIVDLNSKLTELRKMVVRNVNEQDDRFFFEICSK
jgi:hypothetical protein